PVVGRAKVPARGLEDPFHFALPLPRGLVALLRRQGFGFQAAGLGDHLGRLSSIRFEVERALGLARRLLEATSGHQCSRLRDVSARFRRPGPGFGQLTQAGLRETLDAYRTRETTI